MDFDVIPFDDIKGNWSKLGSGSFGNVYKGTYLGIEVAIKEVLPSTEYDVGKYFEREWRLMKEARHPNVVLYLGLSKAPPPSNTIYIISEFIPNGNLRTYIYNRKMPLPWRLRVSFAIDIARALAYLHARQCIHRDLKGENLLLTSNGRLKITDFGFARIAARNAEESRRLTFCGTDSYMSPEILLGNEFGLPTDVFSLGVIFCELIARKLADDHTFKRAPPYYNLDESELQALASPGAPEDFVLIAIQCCSANPSARPTMLQVLDRLKNIELEVLSKDSEAENLHIGSVKLFTGVGTKRGTRPALGPRIPSFGQGVGNEIRGKKDGEKKTKRDDDDEDSGETTPEETSEDEELMEAISSLKIIPSRSASESDAPTLTAKPKQPFDQANDSLPLQHKHVREAHKSESSLSDEPLLHRGDESGSLVYTDYSTSVVRKANGGAPPNLSSILTVRPTAPQKQTGSEIDEPAPISQSGFKTLTTDSRVSVNSYHTADGGTTSSFITNPYASHLVNGKETHGGDDGETVRVGGGYSSSTLGGASIAAATEGGSTVRSEIIGGLHRFTLIKPGATTNTANTNASGAKSAFPGSPTKGTRGISSSGSGYSWSPFDFFFSSGFGFGGGKKDKGAGTSASLGVKGAKCDLCGKRLGWKPCLECDDCGLRSHIKCGEMAPRDCGLRGSAVGLKMQPMASSPPVGKAKVGGKR
ncbi:hypothetical protein M408DRAFT_330223 [Serendipita vermifera MAFF 305830]|uniref:Protein kinase domain-containing protein n=1 Tax=Serendipita vermifera MAFF 305830 TaxID=933852 RepID=A0A0C3ARC9_SERVB|nr:hypothetical protein M408DRAFT_330223 [Serendipita vermifera MAFF 305830]